MFNGFVLILTIVMITKLTTLFILFAVFFGQFDLQPKITAPLRGGVLQGQVAVSGTTDIPGFISAEVAFAYQNDETDTWFVLSQSQQGVRDGLLVSWDTTTITDGTYRLRLRVETSDGQTLETLVENLRVRNYTPVEMDPTPGVTPESESIATAELQPTPILPTPTALPGNPARVTTETLTTSLQCGLIGAAGLFLALGVYLLLRKAARR